MSRLIIFISVMVSCALSLAGAQNSPGNEETAVRQTLILTCCQDEIIYPVETRYACYLFWRLFQ